MSGSPRAGCLPRIGGALALDFCNSTTGRGTDRFVEHLFDYQDLLRWAVFNELLTEGQAAGLLAGTDAAAQAKAYAEAMAARGLLNGIFDDLAKAGGGTAAPAAEQVAALAGRAAGTWEGASLVPDGARFAWRFPPADARPTALLDPILRSAADLLTRHDLARLKACPGPYCGWVFLDATKNAGRVWCEMEVCGTRAKLRTRAARRAQGRGGGG